jgi:hypothetical protein
VGSEGTLCGRDALEACENVTDMKIRLLILGSFLLFWAHMIWVITMVSSFKEHTLKIKVVEATLMAEGDEDKGE